MNNRAIRKLPCGYCGFQSNPRKVEHVFSKTLFKSQQVIIPNDPIKIPSCSSCEGIKNKLENYVAIIMNLSSGKDLGDAHIRGGIRTFSPQQRSLLFNGERRDIKINGLYQDMWVGGVDYTSIEKLLEYIGMGIVYYHTEKPGIKRQYPNRIVAAMPVSSERDTALMFNAINISSPQHIFLDKGRYNNEIKYAAVISTTKAIVHVQIFNPMFSNSKEICRTFAITLTQ
jgi:hypothetical protein